MKWHFSASLLTLWLSSQGWTREEQNIFPLSPFPAAHVKGMKGRCTNTGGLYKFLLGMQETVCIVNIQWLCEIQKKKNKKNPWWIKSETSLYSRRQENRDQRDQLKAFQEGHGNHPFQNGNTPSPGKNRCLLIGEGPFKNMKGLDMKMFVKP